MNKIVCKLNHDDAFHVDNAKHSVDFTSKKEFHLTFYRSLTELYRMPNPFKKEALDLFYISLMVYYADKKISRTHTSDGWTRTFKLYMPVLEYDKWIKNKKLLEEMVSFLSGDIWEFEFRKRETNAVENKIQTKITKWHLDNKFKPEAFCMLSGGLDSFIGAIDILSQNTNIAFVGIYGGGKGVKPFQVKVNNILKKEFKLNDDQFFNFYATPVKGIEDSTRTRSFLFFSHAILLASCLDKETKLYIPENGLISLNIPLTNTRLGSSSTRTTHPFYMSLLQKLLNNLDINIVLNNPYQFLTKGEMLLNCKNAKLISEKYNSTMSCSHPDQGRYEGKTESLHCGTCLPCTIRRSSIKKAFIDDETEYIDENFKKKNAKAELKSFKLGLLEFERSKNNPLIIQIAGPLEKDIEQYHDLYKRGIKELADLLETINE